MTRTRYVRLHVNFTNVLRESGCFLLAVPPGGRGAASCARVGNGKPFVTDGPFAETKEMLSGFSIIEATSHAPSSKLDPDVT